MKCDEGEEILSLTDTDGVYKSLPFRHTWRNLILQLFRFQSGDNNDGLFYKLAYQYYEQQLYVS